MKYLSLALSMHVLSICFALIPPANALEASRPACKPFSIFRGKTPPYRAESKDKTKLDEAALLKSISRIEGHAIFEPAFRKWTVDHPGALSTGERLSWLRCLAFYLSHDTDADGIPDWSALSDDAPTTVLYPQDDDIDGDGTPNVLDPEPFVAKISGVANPKRIPEHLRIARPETSALQEQLFDEFGIIAIDSTDEHSPVVLENLLILLRNGFSQTQVRNLRNLRYLYAFSSHDTRIDIAAYHPRAKAISIGGTSSYDRGRHGIDADLLGSLAHEIGHAFLMDRIAPSELREVSATFGGWGPVFGSGFPLSLYSPAFFTHHPWIKPGSPGSADVMTEARKYNLVSNYGARGVHEWFADAFAATVLGKIGRAKLLGDHWEATLVSVPRSRRRYWFNYNNVLGGFSTWLEGKLRVLNP